MNENTYKNLIESLNNLQNPEKAKQLSRFFKTGKGEYGEGDMFYGITVPLIRTNVRKYFKSLSLNQVKLLLKDKVHEIRLCGGLVLVSKYKTAKTQEEKAEIFNFYCDNIRAINNWDLVDLTCVHIIGNYLLKYQNSDISLLRKLSISDNLWERRISVLSTFEFIRNQRLDLSLEMCERLLFDKHDIIHKAVGWMLREIGKRDFEYELEFINKHNLQIPRTTLRYAIEKFPENLRQDILSKK